MRKEQKIRNRIECKAGDAFKAISEGNTVTAVHFRSNHCLLASNIRPEQKTTNRVNCNASGLFRVAGVDNADGIITIEAGKLMGINKN